jgi:creatinine amidohydrolase
MSSFSDKNLMGNMSWLEYKNAVCVEKRPLLIPVGAIEQHGPHLPLSTDVLIPEAICREVAKRVGCVVAPSMSYGYKSMPHSGGGQHFCGSTGLDAHTLIQQSLDLVRGFTDHGVENIVFVIGHMENQWFLTEACDLAYREARQQNKPLKIMRVGYWEFVKTKTLDQVFGENMPPWDLEHAGIMETSIMLHSYPEMVNMELLEPQTCATLPVYDVWPYDQSKIPESGILNNAIGASAEIGEIFFEEFVSGMSKAIQYEFNKLQKDQRIES